MSRNALPDNIDATKACVAYGVGALPKLVRA